MIQSLDNSAMTYEYFSPTPEVCALVLVIVTVEMRSPQTPIFGGNFKYEDLSDWNVVLLIPHTDYATVEQADLHTPTMHVSFLLLPSGLS